MKSLLTIFFSFLAVITLSQTTEIADPNATVRKLNGSFTGIHVTSGINLHLSEGKEQSLAVSASEKKYEDRLITVIENGILKIYFDNNGINWNSSKRKLTAYVSYTTLNKLRATGGASVMVTGIITSNDLQLEFNSGSVMSGKVQCKNLQVDQESGSSMAISGSAENIKVEASSGAIFKGFNLQSEFCKAKASSGAMIRILINKELDADASSGGSIRYKGSAVIRDIDVSSGGNVKKA